MDQNLPVEGLVYRSHGWKSYAVAMGCTGKMWRGLAALALFTIPVSLGAPSTAHAQEFPAPTDQDYTLDLYQGAAIGSAKIVGMGGVAAATAEGSSGMLTNPAAAGVRLTTSTGTWDWDAHIVTQSPGLGKDTDNNGIFDDDVSFKPSGTAGLAIQYRDWGLGATIQSQELENSFLDGAQERTVSTVANVVKLSFAHYVFDGQLVAGIGARIVDLEINTKSAGGSRVQLAELTGASFETGALWKPTGKSFRLGGTISLPVIVDDIKVDNCDPLNCGGYILPKGMRAPWIATIGVAGRFGPTPWNIKVKRNWRDERALSWGADIVVTGKTAGGYGLEAFGQRQLQPSGRKVSVSLRGGVEYELLPGNLRVRGGSYYEPNRFKDPNGKNIPGRMHATVGLDWHFWTIQVWDFKYRAQFSLWGDASDNYGVTGVSVGFWH